jgi:putative transposase
VGWKDSSVADERLQFIEECKSQEWSMAEVCRRFEISRKTGYKWLGRYDAGGIAALQDGSHAPHHNPRQVKEEVEDRIVEARGKHAHWGPLKLRAWLKRTSPETDWPAASTIGEILHRHGLAVPRKARLKAAPNTEPLKHADGPNVVWCADYKGWFRCQDGSRCDPLTITDAYSRYLLRCQVTKQADVWYTKPLFEATFREYGMPERIRVDNGAPFASVGIGGLSELSVWWIKLGIRPERIEPGKPEQNGRHERMHRTLKQETADPPKANIREQQRAFNAFREEYNHQRPHAALDDQTPGECYIRSPRIYVGRLKPEEYPEGFEVRVVSEGGQIRWNRARVFVGRALEGERIGLEPTEDGKWRVWFSFYELGELDERRLMIIQKPKPKSPSTKDPKK